MGSYHQTSSCRICGNTNLVKVLDLGEQVLTGIFPKSESQFITCGPIQLVKCSPMPGVDVCGLLQMAHSYDLDEMYGDNYGYRSGLNPSMVKHLHAKIARVLGLLDQSGEPLVLDIGSNDGTSLAAYPPEFIRIGMDPTAAKFRQYYPVGVHVIADFFSASKFLAAFPGKKARAITSFSMFYDLERPMEFVKEIAQILDAQGVWVFEQSYMPLMLERNSFDTACHEHLEYYAFKQIHYMLERNQLKVIDVEFNDVNGGSFSVTAALKSSDYSEYSGVQQLLARELLLDDLAPYEAFARRTDEACNALKAFVSRSVNEGKKIACLGASTKGNVLLQYCGFTVKDIFAVAEVNADKFGTFTPGTLIPIQPDELVIAQADFLIVLPWHFKDFFIQKYAACRQKLVFPLPELQIGA
jgi:NDP-4-keto-2,6-dideoxyhexose 3-C-methyltransferase